MVVDPTGAVIPGAVITLTRGTTVVSATSEADGRYEFKNIAAGVYGLSADAQGFAPYAMASVRVGATVRQINLTLSIATQKQQVTVNGEATQVGVDADQNASSVVMKGKDLDGLSDDPDELQSELTALGGPSAGPSGGDLYVDGFSGGRLPPKSTIREIRVNQNPFSAEFDRIGYGRIEIFTKPGAQKLSGSIGGSYVNSALDTAVPLSATQPGYQFHWIDGNVSGPIGKNASFFYEYFNFNRQNQSTINAINPASITATSTGTTLAETFANPSTQIYTSGRIDWQATKSQTISLRGFIFRYNVTGSGVGTLNLPELAVNYSNPANDVQVSDAIVLSPKVAEEINFQWKHEREISTPTSTLPTVTLEGAFTNGGSGTNNENYLTVYELQNYFTATAAKHVMRFGARARGYFDKVRTNSGTNGSYLFQTTQQYLAGTPYLYTASVVEHPISQIAMFDGALFFQDEWRARPNLTLSSGLRLEGQNRIHDRLDWAPRVAVAWSPGQKPSAPAKTVLRAGAGYFYNRLTIPSLFYGGGGMAYLIQTIVNNGVNQQNYVVQDPSFYDPNAAISAAMLMQAGTSTPTIDTIDAHFHSALSLQSAIGVDQQITKKLTMSVNYLYTRGVHQYMMNNVNAPTFDAANYTLIGAAPKTYNYQFQSGGIFKQRQLIVTGNGSVKNLTLHANYVYNQAESDTQGISYFPSVADDPALDYGRATFGVKQQFMLFSTYSAPFKINISPILFAQSGTPYNIMLGNDLTGNNQSNARPTYGVCGAAGVVSTAYGCLDTNPVGKGEQIIPYNLGTGPANVVMHLRVTRSFGVGPRKAPEPAPKTDAAGDKAADGKAADAKVAATMPVPPPRKYTLHLDAGAANVFNVVNFAPPNGTLSSPLFGKSQSLACGPYGLSSPGNRTVYFNASFSF